MSTYLRVCFIYNFRFDSETLRIILTHIFNTYIILPPTGTFSVRVGTDDWMGTGYMDLDITFFYCLMQKSALHNKSMRVCTIQNGNLCVQRKQKRLKSTKTKLNYSSARFVS